MKKVLLTTIFPVIMIGSSMFYVSCNKEDIVNEKLHTSVSGEPLTPSAGFGINRVYNKQIFDCAPPKVNCFDDIIVSPSNFEEIMEVVNAEPEEVGEYFSGNSWHSFLPGLLEVENEEVLQDLQSGDYTLSITINASTNMYYLLVSHVSADTNDDPTYVLPMFVAAIISS